MKALSFGSVVKNDYVRIAHGESAKFTLLFWNVENTSYRVELDVKEAPEGWLIIIQPKDFLLNSSVGDEYISLPYLEKSVKASHVNVFVKPEGYEGGIYRVVIVAKAGSPEKGISFFQERAFKLTVEVIGEQAEKTTESRVQNATKELQPSNDSATETDFNFILYIIIFVCILVISSLIYKYG